MSTWQIGPPEGRAQGGLRRLPYVRLCTRAEANVTANLVASRSRVEFMSERSERVMTWRVWRAMEASASEARA
ncbi:hypothetical protein [Nocardia sp. NPDC004604]|uniref:hypothetical protein n=1 Tax=Nocardia sp. NPDC004604 TaxID=3157013 RepID=UPI0033B64407